MRLILGWLLAGLTLAAACSPSSDSAPDDPGTDGGGTTSSSGSSGTDASAPTDASTPSVVGDASTTADAARLDAGADAARDAGTGAGSDGGSPLVCTAGCAAGTKRCDDVCVSVDDPSYGCTQTGCARPSVVSSTVASFACVAGALKVATCRTDRLDCDGDPTNGCESDIGRPSSCGACGTVCGAGQVCDDGVCKASCAFPEPSCTGACRDLTSSLFACGSCGGGCTKETCTNGVCSGATSCPAGTHACSSGSCRFDDDPDFCGASCARCPGALGSVRACIAGACGFSGCAAGYTSCGGACVATNSDTAHCGACDTPCAGGEVCAAGACTAPTNLRMVTGLSTPEDIIAANGRLFVTDVGSNEVLAIDTATAAVTTLGTAQAKPWRIAVDDTYAYWSSHLGGAILRAPIGGGAAPVVLANTVQPTSVALDGDTLYFASGTSTYRIPKTGGAPQLVAAVAPDIDEGYVVQGGMLFMLSKSVDTSRVWRLDPTTKATSQIFAESRRTHFGLVGTSEGVVWQRSTSLGQVVQVLAYGFDGAASWSTTSQGPLATVQASDGCHLFSASGTGIYTHEPRHASPVLVTSAGVQPRRLAVDGTYVYWTDQSGFIGRVPR